MGEDSNLRLNLTISKSHKNRKYSNEMLMAQLDK